MVRAVLVVPRARQTLGVAVVWVTLVAAAAGAEPSLRSVVSPRGVGTTGVVARYDLGDPGLHDDALTLGRVIDTALARHPSLASAAARIQRSEGILLSRQGAFDTRLEAQGKWQPQGKHDYGIAGVGIVQDTPYWGLSARGGWRIGAGDVPIYFGDDATQVGGEFYVGVSLPLLQGGAVDRARTDIAQAELGVQSAEVMRVLVALDLRRAATHAYWTWVAAGLSLIIERELLDIAQTRMDQINTRVQRGELPPIDAIENERTIYLRRGRVVDAERALAEAAQSLSVFLRDGDGEPLVATTARLPRGIPAPDGEPQALQVEQTIDAALLRRPDLTALELEVRAAELEAAWADNLRLPRLDVTLDLAQGAAPPDQLHGKDTEIQLGLKFSVPLQLRRATGLAAAARADAQDVSQRARLVRDRIRADIGRLSARLSATYQGLLLAQQELEVAKAVEAGEVRRLELGDSTLLLVNIRELSTADAAQKVVGALAEYRRALADVEAVTAEPFPADSPYADAIPR